MIDRIEPFGESIIQHGKCNDRAYLMKVAAVDLPELIEHAESLCEEHGYSKIFAKTPAAQRDQFLQQGFVEEARVPDLFQGSEDGCFVSRYLDVDRRREQEPETVLEVIHAAIDKRMAAPQQPDLDPGFDCRLMQPEDTPAMVELYREVFATYPFPIHDPAYLEKTMAEDVVYHGIHAGEELVALASSEIDPAGQNAEMTDFATRPDFRGQGLASFLLERMEGDVARRGGRTAYTIARAYSFGMNITFARQGYRFAGTLTNNTQISGRLESMNVWHKPLTS